MTWHAPTAEQAAAIAARDRDSFCEAGAGSGKTRVLADRYCDAVTIDGVGIDQILAFTFTERAAAELRQRVRRELARRSEQAGESGDQGLARELRTLARDTERAWVTTIHGFCRRLLAHHPVAAGLDPRFRVIDAAEATRVLTACCRQALDDAVAEGDEGATRVAAAMESWRLVQALQLAYEGLRGQGMARPALPAVPAPTATDKAGDDAPLTQPQKEAALEAKATLDRLLERLADRYEAAKTARSGLDFADLELHTIELLRSSEAVRSLWRGRFKHLMVDEFQDTNQVQLDLIGALRGEETRLFTVGDENQSIYRFRGADLEVFRHEREVARTTPAVEVLGLRGSFRSLPPVLATANCLGRSLLPGFQELTAGRTDEAGGPRVELLLSLNEGNGKDHRKWADHAEDLDGGVVGSPKVVAKARALAERLRELVDEGAARPGDIVVLLRAFTHVDAFREALDRFGLEPYVVGGRGYWSQQQVEDLLRPLSVIANPLDDEMLFGALAGPGCQASPDTLWLLRRGAGSGQHIWPILNRAFGVGDDGFEAEDPEALALIAADDAARLGSFVARIRGLRAEMPVLPLDGLVEKVMEAFDHDLALLARHGAEGRMANVRKLMRLAADYERDEGRDLRGFLTQAFAATRADEREGLAPVQSEDHDGVRLMTVHGAKGLEFPVVCVPDLDRELTAGGQNADVLIGKRGADGNARFGLRLPFPTTESVRLWDLVALGAAAREAEAEEALRLVYVAVTRAQERLILSGTYRPKDLEPCEVRPNQSTLARWLPDLVDLGWSGAPGEITLPAPAPAIASLPQPAPARLA
ncbi:MAG: ATP-dependent helicase, partial [Actinomycetota bacterium]|nr:ATP-dependent helicase [Actinomycetota bacterium]